MAVGVALIAVVAQAVGAAGLDVADLAEDLAAGLVDEGEGAVREGAAVAGHGKESFHGGRAWDR